MSTDEEATHQSIRDGRADVADALVRFVYGDEGRDLEEAHALYLEIVDDPFIGVERAFELHAKRRPKVGVSCEG